MSDPQLRKDIAALSLKLAQANQKIAELESAAPKTVVKEVVKEVPVTTIKRVEVPIVKEVPVPYVVEKEVVKHVKCPKQEALIKSLRAKLKGE